ERNAQRVRGLRHIGPRLLEAQAEPAHRPGRRERERAEREPAGPARPQDRERPDEHADERAERAEVTLSRVARPEQVRDARGGEQASGPDAGHSRPAPTGTGDSSRLNGRSRSMERIVWPGACAGASDVGAATPASSSAVPTATEAATAAPSAPAPSGEAGAPG